jgi:hypothetical protein
MGGPEAAMKVFPTATAEFFGKLSWIILASFIFPCRNNKAIQ